MDRVQKNRYIILLAKLNRFVFPLLAAGIPALMWFLRGGNLNLTLGISMMIFGGYNLYGFGRFRHIYCAWQMVKREPLTPDHIEWDRVPKSDGVWVPMFFVGIGIVNLILAWLCYDIWI